ncbi:hypothetical protein [Novosphingobium sp.]|uniref:COG3904 family protein n=1 Tax=Novosphingobium sp. TaxID=1874826 RepID=UPI002869FCB7|nr:hypothetical protein [Novosphingobium sp.]
MMSRFTGLKLLLPALAGAALLAPQLAAQPASPAPAPVTTTVQPASQPNIYLSADGKTIYLIGSIMDDSFKRFDALLSRSPNVRTLFLSSPGGLTLEARLIAAEVRKRRLSTYVEQYCASACTQLFVAGRERVIGKEGVLGFHQAVGVDRRGRATRVNRATERKLSPTTVFGVNGNDTLRLAYELAGIDKGFIDKVLEKSHEEMWFPSAKELTAAKVITRQADGPEFPLPEGSISQADLRALLAKRPLWERAAKKYPATYEEGFASAWRLGNSGTPLEVAISSGRADLVIEMMSRVARASDSLLDRHLTLYADEARRQSVAGFPLCDSALDDGTKPLSEATLAFERTEDALLVEAMDSPPAVEVMSKKEAMKIFAKDIVPLLPSNFGTGNTCRAGFQMIMAVDKLPGSRRIKAYRAMLFLPDALGV